MLLVVFSVEQRVVVPKIVVDTCRQVTSSMIIGYKNSWESDYLVIVTTHGCKLLSLYNIKGNTHKVTRLSKGTSIAFVKLKQINH
uniref:Uncharacterized protein n=1 Tax=Arundo donax TaxID=35708 RepID=A0A0A9AD14_ARUDO